MKRIEIAGNIASGKTTIANILNNYGYHCVYEDFKSVPYWRKFFESPNKYNFETEISFLLQHYHQIKLAQSDSIVICDFSFINDLAYAKLGLSKKRHEIFTSILYEILAEISEPILTIQAASNVNLLLDRIKYRGRTEENSITRNFLIELDEKLNECFIYNCPILNLSNETDFYSLENNLKKLLILD